MSNRHLARTLVLQILYQWDFRGKPTAALPAIIEQTLLDFGDDIDENNEDQHKVQLGMKRQQQQMNIFLGKQQQSELKLQKKRLPYFERRKLFPVMTL